MMAIESWPHYISQYGYAAIFLVALVEGPIVTVFASFLASQGVFSVPVVFGTVVLGDLVGDTIYYAVGRWGVGRWGLTRFDVTRVHRRPGWKQRVEHIGKKLREEPCRILLFGKLTHSVGFVILLAAGAARVKVGEFLLYNLLGTLPKSALFVLLGYLFGQFYVSLSGWLHWASLFAFVVAVGVIIYMLHRWSASCEGTQ